MSDIKQGKNLTMAHEILLASRSPVQARVAAEKTCKCFSDFFRPIEGYQFSDSIHANTIWTCYRFSDDSKLYCDNRTGRMQNYHPDDEDKIS